MAWSTVHFGIFQLQGWPGCCITGSDRATDGGRGTGDRATGQVGSGGVGLERGSEGDKGGESSMQFSARCSRKGQIHGLRVRILPGLLISCETPWK